MPSSGITENSRIASHPYLCLGRVVRRFVDVPVLAAVRGRVRVAEYYSIISHLENEWVNDIRIKKLHCISIKGAIHK